MLTNYENKKKEVEVLKGKLCKVEKTSKIRDISELKFLVEEIFTFEPSICFMSTILGIRNHNCRQKKIFPEIKPEVISIVPFTKLQNAYSG